MCDLEEYNEIFCRNCNEYVGIDSLCAILSGDIIKFRFILETVVKTFETVNCNDSRMLPNPIKYFSKIYNVNLTYNDIKIFTDVVSNIEDFISLFFDANKRMLYNKDLNIVLLLRKNYGSNFVRLLYFFIFTNTVSFKSINLLGKEGYVFAVSHDIDKERSFYEINSESMILFHGTSINNIYSIMRNGIRSMSKTKYMTNGNTYGDGIYLTKSFYHACQYGILNRQTSFCVLIFNCKNLNHKDNCYVQQENSIILRIILWINTHSNKINNIEETLTNYAKSINYSPTKLYSSSSSSSSSSSPPPSSSSSSSPPPSSFSSSSSSSSSSSLLTVDGRLQVVTSSLQEPLGVLGDFIKLRIENPVDEPMNSERVVYGKRFEAEIKNLEKELDGVNSVIIRMNFMIPGDRLSPLLLLLRASKGSDLEKDLIKYNIPGILVAFYFTEGSSIYPLVPPKVRVVKPIFVRHTGRVTEGGSICANILYTDAWSPINTISSVAISISDLMSNEGVNKNGRIDPQSLNTYYTYSQYEKSYTNTANIHGFNT